MLEHWGWLIVGLNGRWPSKCKWLVLVKERPFVY
jgi:hypothetical protein